MTDVEASKRVLYAEFTAKPGHEPEVARLVRDYAEHVRVEPGNLYFAAHQKRDNPSSFFVYEEYRDSVAFGEHVAAAYGSAFNAALVDLIVGDGSDLTFLVPL
jgi:quinol monooxygenase YgiN